MNMNFLELVEKRYSCRSYKADPVPSDMLMKLVDAGRWAPSSRNSQPWEFVVVTEVSTLRDLGKLISDSPFIAHAAACIVVFCRSDAQYALEDGSAATENILLAAVSLGLGACWVAGDKKSYAPDVARMLSVPSGYKLISLIPVGMPKDMTPPDRKRRSLKEVLHWQNF
jgi:nitroreductase